MTNSIEKPESADKIIKLAFVGAYVFMATLMFILLSPLILIGYITTKLNPSIQKDVDGFWSKGDYYG